MFGAFGHYRSYGCGRRFARGEWAGPRFGGRGGFHELRGGGRVFDQGELRFVILQLIAEKPRHGYEIIKDIEDRLAGAYSPSPGVVYPTLTLLEELGYARVTAGDGGKKLYAVTPEGEAALATNRPTVDAIFARIEAIRTARGGGPPAPVMRAMHNLRVALRLRLGRGPLSEAEINAITMALDAAAVAVERS